MVFCNPDGTRIELPNGMSDLPSMFIAAEDLKNFSPLRDYYLESEITESYEEDTLP